MEAWPTEQLGAAFVHFSLLPDSDCLYFCRAWAPRSSDENSPLYGALEFDDATGQPWQKYQGTCVIHVKAGVAEIIGLLCIPTLVFWRFRRKVAYELNCHRMVGDSWDEQRKVKRRVELNLTTVEGSSTPHLWQQPDASRTGLIAATAGSR